MSTSISLTGYETTDHTVTAAHFGANALIETNTDAGTPNARFEATHSASGAGDLRFPGGNTEAVFQNGLMPGGDLPPEVRAFFQWAQDNDVAATMVVPTGASYTGAQDMEVFVQALLREFGDTVNAIEIGNEFWNADNQLNEIDYAEIASEIVEVIDGVVTALADDSAEAPDPDILIQMASPRGEASNFHPSNIDGPVAGYRTRVAEANQQLIDHLSDGARAAIDGVVEHFYYRRDTDEFTGNRGEFNHFDVAIATWHAAFGADLAVHISEWNIDNMNLSQLGMRSAGTILEMMQLMVGAGVDAAQAWPLVHNTTNDFAGANGQPLAVDEETGLILNSIGGAVFDLMSDSLVGTQIITTDFAGLGENFEINTYGNADKIVLYLASRTHTRETVSLDLGDMIAGYGTASAIRIGQDQSTSDGRHFSPRTGGMVDATGVDLNGDGVDDYYVDEHDVFAEITTFTGGDIMEGNHVSVSLDPFEVIEITFTLPQGGVTHLGDGNDRFHGGRADEFIWGHSGDDTIHGHRGADHIYGGFGDDTLRGGRGGDTLFGDAGADILHGGRGHDLAQGGAGDDTLYGGRGRDTLIGGDGDDVLIGGAGRDTVIGGAGADQFVFRGAHIARGGDILRDFEIGVDTVVIRTRGGLTREDLWLSWDDPSGVTIVGFAETTGIDGRLYFEGDFTGLDLFGSFEFETIGG